MRIDDLAAVLEAATAERILDRIMKISFDAADASGKPQSLALEEINALADELSRKIVALVNHGPALLAVARAAEAASYYANDTEDAIRLNARPVLAWIRDVAKALAALEEVQ